MISSCFSRLISLRLKNQNQIIYHSEIEADSKKWQKKIDENKEGSEKMIMRMKIKNSAIANEHQFQFFSIFILILRSIRLFISSSQPN